MNILDFLSSSPKNFIFQKQSNKTNLGGILSLIYLIIFLMISTLYITSYAINDKYNIEYFLSHHAESVYDKESDREIILPEESIPYFNLEFRLVDYESDKNLIDRLTLWETNAPDSITNFNTSEKAKIEHDLDDLNDYYEYKIKKRRKFVQYYKFQIVYMCQKEECSEIKDIFDFEFKLDVFYNQFNISHQEKVPLYQVDKSDKLLTTYLRYNGETQNFTKSQHILNWDIVKYREEKGFLSLFDKIMGKDKNKYSYGLFLESKESIEYDQPSIVKVGYVNIADVIIKIHYERHEEYTRKEIGIIDVISNICSLSLTILSIFTLIFNQIYSKNFDNYKIVQKILSKNEKQKIKIELNNNLPLLADNNYKNELMINSDKESYKVSGKNIDNTENEDDDEEDENIDLDKESNIILPKLHLYDYILNNIYCKKCIPSKKQQLINECNEILAKYFSIENIISNQIILENLLKDYKWNEPSLAKLENSQMISQLKKYI